MWGLHNEAFAAHARHRAGGRVVATRPVEVHHLVEIRAQHADDDLFPLGCGRVQRCSQHVHASTRFVELVPALAELWHGCFGHLSQARVVTPPGQQIVERGFCDQMK